MEILASQTPLQPLYQIGTNDTFVISPSYESWFFFVDEKPGADWWHPCKYIFISTLGGDITVTNKQTPPNYAYLDVIHQVIPIIDYDESDFFNIQPQLPKNTNLSNNEYAVIISGGYEQLQNYPRYYNHCRAIYQTLVNIYHYDKNKIFVIMDNGSSTEPSYNKGTYYNNIPVSYPLDLDGDGVNDIQYSATKSNIAVVFNTLRNRVTANDNVFVFVTDHGGSGSTIALWNKEQMTKTEFAQEINKINHAKSINLCLVQCYSGGYTSALQGNNRVISTSCAANQVAYGMPSTNYLYSEFCYHWLSAVTGFTPDNHTVVNADYNNDGFVTMDEAFKYARTHDTRNETPQYKAPFNPDLGTFLSLSGILEHESDLYIRDVEADNGVEPSNTNGCMWNSPDIWIEDFDNNVVDNPRGGEEYYVCVRVHNNKNIPSNGTEKLYLNWAKAGTDLRWRSSWDGEHFFNCDRAVLKGDVIDEDVPIPSIAANSSIVVRVPWVVPVAERYMSCSEFDSELWHFCLVARVHDGNEIVNEDDENGDMAYFVERNNNVAWKNLSVLSSYSKGAVVSVSNPFREKRFFRLTYKSDLNKAGEPLEKFADVYLMLDEGLLDAWKVSGCKGSGFKQVSDNMFLMTDREVVLDNLYLNPDEHHTIQTDVCFFTQSVPQDSVFDFDIALYYWDKELQIIGGEHYMAIKNMDRDFKALALNDTSVLMSQAVSFSAVNINEPAQYTWYDVNGDTVGTGMNLTVQPMTSQQYKLEVVAEADGAKDYDTVSVAVRGGMLVSLSPNPANDRIDVEYRLADNVSNALIQIVSSTGIIVNTIPITNTQTSITINIQALASGSYSVGLLLPNGEIPDMKTLIVR